MFDFTGVVLGWIGSLLSDAVFASDKERSRIGRSFFQLLRQSVVIRRVREFHNFKKPYKYPSTIIISQEVYESLSVELSKLATKQLIWTLFKSPLLIDKPELFKKFLERNRPLITKYDEKFKSFETKKESDKIRVVIFSSHDERTAFNNVDVDWHLANGNDSFNDFFKEDLELNRKLLEEYLLFRKEDFIEANKGNCLLFCTVQELLDDYNKHHTNKYYQNDRLNLEFGYIRARKAEFGFESGFHSGRSQSDAASCSYFTFFGDYHGKENSPMHSGDQVLDLMLHNIPLEIWLIKQFSHYNDKKWLGAKP